MFEEVFFPVISSPVTKNGEPTKRVKIIREDTNELISVVSNQYTLIPNKSVDSVITSMLPANLKEAYSDGFFSRFSYTVDSVSKPVSRNDIVQMMLTVENSYDGTKRLRISVDALRLACMNGLLIGEKVYESQILHKSKSKEDILNEIQNSLVSIDSHFDNLVSKLKSMKKRKLTEQDKMNIVLALSKFPKYIHSPLYEKLIKEQGTTMYDIYNSVTHFTTHELKINNVSRLNIVSELNQAILNI